MNQLFGRQIAITRCVYLRVFIFGLINLLVILTGAISNFFPVPMAEFYPGWSVVHADWTPVSVSASEWRSQGRFAMFGNVWNVWINVWLALAIFGLFGLTEDARNVYVRTFSIATRWPGRVFPRGSQSEILSLPSASQHEQMRSAEIKYVGVHSVPFPVGVLTLT